MNKYSGNASKVIEKTLHKYKEGTLKSGKTKKRVKSRKQAIAIGISEARKKHYKVPEDD